ncbi:protein FAM170A-like [Dipodomys merriami]|uniref:protein FAM170A-like n=1 Tax=Dipodomys merriami TaxID=94247 RepID=UPI003855679C
MSSKPGPSRLSQDCIKIAKTSKSILCTSSMDKPIHKERQLSQVTALTTRAACSPAEEESSSDSIYYSCVSSPSNFPLLDKKRPMNPESSSAFPLNYFPMSLVDHKPSTSSALVETERVMKVYYMHVRLKRGVAVLPELEDLEPPRKKKIKLDNIMFPEKIAREVRHSDVATHELLCDSEVSVDQEAQERPEEPEGPVEPAAPEDRSRPQTPEWLVALEHGYRCMACCRVFSSLEILQDHVEHGVSQGFSCHAFHSALASLRSKRKHKKKKRTSKTPDRDPCSE